MLIRLDRAMRRRVDARSVTVTRVMLGLALIIVSIESFVVLMGIAAGKVAYPFAPWTPHPTSTTASGLLALGWLAGVSLTLGLLPHVMAGIGAGLGVITLLWDQQLYSSHLTFLTVMLLFLVFAESDRHKGLSSARHSDEAGVPWWPQFLMMTQVSAVYLFAGLSKAQPTFLSGRPLEGWMWAELPFAAYGLLAWGTVITELALSVALWVRQTRKAAAVVGVILHLSIVVLLAGENLWLVAFALTTTASYPLFLTRPTLGESEQAHTA